MNFDNFYKGAWASFIPVLAAVVFSMLYGVSQWLVIQRDGNEAVIGRSMQVSRIVGAYDAPSLENPAISQKALPNQYEWRLKWMLYASATLLVNLFMVFICILIMLTWTPTWKYVLVLTVLCCGLGSISNIAAGMPLLDPMVDRIVANDAPPNLKGLVEAINAIGLTVAIIFSATISVLLLGKEGKFEDLKKKRAQLTLLLYFATAALILALLRGDALSKWSFAFMVTDESTWKALTNFSGTINAALGGFFTLFLASVYMPAAFILKRRAELRLTDDKVDSATLSTNLNDGGFSFSYSDSLPKLLAIVLPVLAGTLSGAIEQLTLP